MNQVVLFSLGLFFISALSAIENSDDLIAHLRQLFLEKKILRSFDQQKQLRSENEDTKVYTSGAYKLTFINKDPNLNPNTKQQIIDTYFTVMPKLCSRFNENCAHQISITIDPKEEGVAYAVGSSIVISAAWLKKKPEDTDVVTHESMHIVQDYGDGAPGWLTEGIADYARWKFGLNNDAAGWSLPDFEEDNKYTDSYTVTARFLVWCEKQFPSIVNQLDSALRSGTYSTDSWSEFTDGESLEKLWDDYKNNPEI